MAGEPVWYRSWKWVVQKISTWKHRGMQLERLEKIDWDVLVVMDACRWDVLDSVVRWPMGSIRSPGSATDEWLSEIAKSRTFEGANIATGNVKYDHFEFGAVNIAHLWKTDWHEALGTVLPEPVLDRSDRFLTESDRPVVAHVMPPHAPYVAKLADMWLPAYPRTAAWSHGGAKNADEDNTVSAQVAMASGRIDIERARNSYEASVESTWQSLLPYVSDWINRGYEVVITADHGEGFGGMRDFGLFGHPNKCHVRPLVRVPFERFSPLSESGNSADSVTQKLQALGYME